MVSSIVRGTAGALGAGARLARGPATALRQGQAHPAGRVEMNVASLAAARESVRAGIAQLHEALAAGHEAQSLLVKAQAVAHAGGDGARDELKALLSAYAEHVEAAIKRGARVLAGEPVSVQAEPGAAPVVIAGVDLRLKAEPGPDDVVSVPANARAGDPGLTHAVQRSIEALQGEMTRLIDAARALEAHQGFLGAAEGAANVRDDLDADSARLLALQVRQGLEAAGGASIANVEPQAVLALFRL